MTPEERAGVVGIDPSLTSTGLAHIDFEGNVTELYNLGRKGRRGEPLEERAERVYTLAQEIIEWTLAIETPQLVVIEAPSFGSQGGSAFDRAGVWWRVVGNLWAMGIPVAQVAPRTRAKYGTGDGRSDKKVVKAHVIETYTDILPSRIRNDDQADALLLASMGARHLGMPIEPAGLPERNLEAMEAVVWPLAL